MRILMAFLVMTLVGGLALAQSPLTGQWDGQTERGRVVTLNLKANGAQLNGTLTINKQPGAISEGKISGNTFTFKAPMQNKVVSFTGKLVNDTVELAAAGEKVPLRLKRTK